MNDFEFSHRLKVRYSEVDGQKVVYNSHYLMYLDIAVSEYFAERLTEKEAAQFDYMLVKSTLNYHQSARYNDWLTIRCRMERIGTKSMTVSFVITKDDEVEPILTAEIVYVYVDPVTIVSATVPDFIRTSFQPVQQ
ncbi:thioesterase family protein [Geomicrobium sp. JCM 19055]|uniref:acyl-CoA thioesterase n=1 Tax=Geomicrobium sp. JCM 19055 TaxID=1460649 RepID=UPI00045ED642|nr:thioesterase family protein [Geomicrobium sp. JCM 19055]GAJ98954.1 4-hydroxybenzoyl-CoA thioesterase family active site [Geomicrobium sp. JCM 19055]